MAVDNNFFERFMIANNTHLTRLGAYDYQAGKGPTNLAAYYLKMKNDENLQKALLGENGTEIFKQCEEDPLNAEEQQKSICNNMPLYMRFFYGM